MTDPLQAVLFPPRKPGWLLRDLRDDWHFDLDICVAIRLDGYTHFRRAEINNNGNHALVMLCMTHDASKCNERTP